MIFGLFTLFVALVISAIAEYYSIIGLTAIFSAAFWPIVIMGAALGVGKLTAAVWLKLNWDRASWAYKMYLVPAVLVLMLLTSIGCFGYLSKAHSDQSLVSGDSQAKVAIYDEKIKTARENIDANRKALKQMDEAVDQVMARSQDEKGADKAVAIRRGQQKERQRLLTEIDTEQKTISKLNEERAPLAAEFRKVESEVGPIKYIAALVYGDNPDSTILEKAVRLVIIIIVAVFDPLALVLILAAQQSIRWARQEAEEKEDRTPVYVYENTDPPTPEELAEIDKAYEQDDGPLTQEQIDQIKESAQAEETKSEDPAPAGWMFDKSKYPYLNEPFIHFKSLTPIPGKPSEEPVVEVVEHKEEVTVIAPEEELVPASMPEVTGDSPERPGDYVETPAEVSKFPKVPETAKRHKAEPAYVPATLNVNKIGLQADNVAGNASHSDFGTKFPDTASKGDMFLRVDYLPNKLFKFNGQKWIEVDKSKTDSYTYDEQYILFLIDKLQSGEYELDQLSASEQELVAEKLQQIANDKT